MNRRDFLQQASLLSAGALFSVNPTKAIPVSKYKMGLQLFTVNKLLPADVKGTLQKIAAIGYQDCETYGYNAELGTYYGLKAGQFKQLLDNHGLVTTSGHYDFTKYFDKPAPHLLRFVDQCAEGAQALNQRYITWPWLDPAFRTLPHFRQLAGKLNTIGERLARSNIGFAYHNHDFEFIDQGGKNGYEIILEETDPALVKLQLDLYWVMHSSQLSPAELIEKQPGRFVMWHIKDMDKKSRDYSELGNGSIDFSVILPLAAKAGLEYYYIEQGGNFAKDPLQSITDSAVYFKKHLEKYLT